MAARRFTFTDFLLRWAFGVLLVLLTFNPTEWNYVAWLRDVPGQLPFKALAGLLLAVGYVIYLRATWSAMGLFGIVLVAALLGAIGWVLVDQGMIDLTDRVLSMWLALVAAGTVLGIGLSWSHIRRILSGQVDVDDVET